jgi:hypothetical protein
MNEQLIPHLVEAVILLLMGAWVKKLQARTDQVEALVTKVAVLEAGAVRMDDGLKGLEDKIEDVRENMMRRGDLELLRGVLRS